MALERKKTNEISTDSLIFKKGKIKDYLQVYEYDFRELSNQKLVKSDLSKVKGWFSKGCEYFERRNDQRHVFDWIVYTKKNNEPIGNLMAYGENIKKLKIEMAFNLHPKYWGNGYTEEVFSFISNYLFCLGYNSISVVFSSKNKKSHDILCKLGFKLDKIKEDAWLDGDVSVSDYVMKITKTRWLEQNKKTDACELKKKDK